MLTHAEKYVLCRCSELSVSLFVRESLCVCVCARVSVCVCVCGHVVIVVASVLVCLSHTSDYVYSCHGIRNDNNKHVMAE